jgi:ABC-type glycerol-3-phosphate transport system permease component
MRSRRASPRAVALEFARHAALLVGAAFMLFPFVVMVSTSLKPAGEIFSPSFALLPQTWAAVENYTTAFTRIPLARFVLNGIFVGFMIFFFQALIAVPCAYALAKLRFRGRETIFAFVLLGLLIPPQAPAIPLYIGMWKMGLLDTYAALIIPSSISVFGIFLMRQFFRQIPDDLIHAARIDGLGDAGADRLRRAVAGLELERFLLAAHRHSVDASDDAAARHRLLRQCGGWHELRPPHGRRRHRHRAPRPRFSRRPAPLS